VYYKNKISLSSISRKWRHVSLVDGNKCWLVLATELYYIIGGPAGHETVKPKTWRMWNKGRGCENCGGLIIELGSVATTMNFGTSRHGNGVILHENLPCFWPTSFPGLSCEDEGRDEKALVWAGHVTTKYGYIWQLLVKEWRDILRDHSLFMTGDGLAKFN
jgi:hypothetical protein